MIKGKPLLPCQQGKNQFCHHYYCAVEAETLAQYLPATQLTRGIRIKGVTHSHLFKTPLSVSERLISGASPAVLLNTISLCEATHGKNVGVPTFVLSHFTFGLSEIAKSRKASVKALSKIGLVYGGGVPFSK